MISLSFGHLLLAYAGGLLVLLLAIWAGHEFFRARRDRRGRRHSLQCAHCGTRYESPGTEPLAPCPLCAQRNERVPPPWI